MVTLPQKHNYLAVISYKAEVLKLNLWARIKNANTIDQHLNKNDDVNYTSQFFKEAKNQEEQLINAAIYRLLHEFRFIKL